VELWMPPKTLLKNNLWITHRTPLTALFWFTVTHTLRSTRARPSQRQGCPTPDEGMVRMSTGEGGKFVAMWLYNGGTTPVENGRRFLTPLVCAGCLLTGWEAAFAWAERCRTPPDLPEQAVSTQPAQTSGVRKGLTFSLCIRSEVTTPL